jgi:sigma-B regulation protein RsbU (phosphoserine phosphatase)
VTGSGAAESPDTLFDATATELFEDAPCGYITTDLDGVLVRVNRTFERLTGHRREDLAGKARFADLLSAGGRIYYETHYAPLLMMQGSVNEIALEIRRADGVRRDRSPPVRARAAGRAPARA